jgi:hypothetical protein
MRATNNGAGANQSPDMEADRTFFARLGLAFAVSILVSGIMMVAMGPVPPDAADAPSARTVLVENSAGGTRP